MTKRQKNFIKGTVSEADNDENMFFTSSEKFFTTKFAPILTSNKGRLSVIIVWLILLGFATYGLTKVKTDFNKDFFIPRESLAEDYNNLLKKYYDIGGLPTIILDNEELDFASEEV